MRECRKLQGVWNIWLQEETCSALDVDFLTDYKCYFFPNQPTHFILSSQNTILIIF